MSGRGLEDPERDPPTEWMAESIEVVMGAAGETKEEDTVPSMEDPIPLELMEAKDLFRGKEEGGSGFLTKIELSEDLTRESLRKGSNEDAIASRPEKAIAEGDSLSSASKSNSKEQ